MNEKNAQQSNFLKFIAYLQIIGIIFVVLGHSFELHPDGEGGHSLLLYRMMYSFRMPLFLFVSGFLMVYTSSLKKFSISWKKFAAGKFRRLMIPFITLTLITFVPRALMSGMAEDTIELSFKSLAESLIFSNKMVIPFFWFLQTSFTLLIITYAAILFTHRLNLKSFYCFIVLIIVFLTLNIILFENISLFSINTTVRLGIYFILGTTYGYYHQSIDKVIPWSRGWFILACIALWAILFFLTENTQWIIFCSVSGITMCVGVAKMLEERHFGFLDHLIGANYLIFLLSWYFNVLSQQVLSHFITTPWWINTIFSFVFGLYIPWLFYRYMRKRPDNPITKFSTRFLGQSFKR